jgi:hypothetical protein
VLVGEGENMLPAIVWAAKISLASVLLLAGLGKLIEPSGARHFLKVLGLPPSLVGPALLVAVAWEIAASFLLMAAPTVGGIVTALLFVVFTVAVARMRADVVGSCGCLGALSDKRSPADSKWKSVAARLFGLLAALVVAFGGETIAQPNVAQSLLVAVGVLALITRRAWMPSMLTPRAAEAQANSELHSLGL